MLHMSVAEPTCHEFRGWLNLKAPLNVAPMVVATPVCHESRGWL